MKDYSRDSITIGVVGAGIMGRGIAQLAAGAGLRVVLFDTNQAVTADAVQFVQQMFERAVEKGRMQKDKAVACLDQISTTADLDEFADADLVIEAIIENLEAKQSLFRELEGIVSRDCILATNTSSLSVTAVANAVTVPDRIAGCHFFNPVPLMKLVEVIGGVRTAQPILTQLEALVKRLGHTPVRVKDSPGFLVNHFGRGLNTEGLRVYHEGVAEPHVIDAVVRDCIGLRMGPFELMDLTALDVTCPVSEQLYEQFYHEPRLRPTPTLRQRYIAGVLGRKVGEGFYSYSDGNKIVPAEPEVPSADTTAAKFWISKTRPELALKLERMLSKSGLVLDTGEQPQSDSIAVVTPVGLDATTEVINTGLKPAQSVAVDMMFNTDKRIVLMGSPGTEQQVMNTAWAALAATSRAVSVIPDSPGFIAQRIAANIINTACEIAQLDIAEPAAIDTGARLGLGYPVGPLSMGDATGPGVVLEILQNLYATTGDPRYRPSLWLRRRAMLGLSLLHVQ